MNNNNALAKLTQASRMLAEAKSLDDILKIKDLAQAGIAFAKAAHLGNDSINYAKEIKTLAEYKGGIVLIEMKKRGERIGQGGDKKSKSHDDTLILDDLGITKGESSRWQQMAQVSETEIKEIIDDKKQDGILTTNEIVKEVKRRRPKKSKPTPKTVEGVRLYCGDMLDVLPTLDNQYDLVLADPPYNVTEWDWDKLGTPTEFLDLTAHWLNAVMLKLKPQYNLFWFCSPRYSADIEMVLRGVGLFIQSRIVWHRRNMAMGSDSKQRFIDSWEMIFHCGNRELNFPEKWNDGRFDVQTFAVPQTNFNDTKLHPTQKPLDLIKWLVNYGSFPGDNILDPFAGSGTTGAAADGKRNCDLVEMDSEYVKVIEGRLGIEKH
jgi:DNA modification methylase